MKRAKSKDYLNILSGEFERRPFKVDISTWAVRQHKTEIDMYDVTKVVEHDISVMSENMAELSYCGMERMNGWAEEVERWKVDRTCL